MQVASEIGPPSQSRELSKRVFEEVNQFRRGIGARPLTRHAGLERLAQNHANYLLKHKGSFSVHGSTVSHYGFEGRSLLAREKYGLANLSENVASTTSSPGVAPARLVDLWKNSRDHAYSMKATWTITGLGVAVAPDGTIIAVQLFGVEGIGSHNQMMDKFRQF